MMYKHMADHTREYANEELGETKGRRYHNKEIWWWNTKVQAIISGKKVV